MRILTRATAVMPPEESCNGCGMVDVGLGDCIGHLDDMRQDRPAMFKHLDMTIYERNHAVLWRSHPVQGLDVGSVLSPMVD